MTSSASASTVGGQGRRRRVRPLATVAALAAAAALSACGSSQSASSTTTTTSGAPATPSSRLTTATVRGLGVVLVDGRGRTVYVLTSSSGRNVPCTAASGCAAVWPPLAAAGAATPTLGPALAASKLSMTTAGHTTYVTYGGWRLYEYAGDTGPAQSNGQGIVSYGGTWRALHPDGTTVGSSSSTSSSTSHTRW